MYSSRMGTNHQLTVSRRGWGSEPPMQTSPAGRPLPPPKADPLPPKADPLPLQRQTPCPSKGKPSLPPKADPLLPKARPPPSKDRPLPLQSQSPSKDRPPPVYGQTRVIITCPYVCPMYDKM